MSSALLDKPIVPEEPASREPGAFRLTEQQRNAIAMMSVSGTGVAEIARAVGRSTATVRAILREDQDVLARVAHYESKLLKAMAVHHFEMMSMLDQARVNIREGLTAPDLKVRLDTSWRLHEAVVPAKSQKLDVNLDVTGETRHEIAVAAASLVGSLAELKERSQAPAAGFLRSIKSELPGPTSLTVAEEKEPE